MGVTPRQAQFDSQLEDQPTKPERGCGLCKHVPTKCLSQYSKERQQSNKRSARIQQGKEQKSKHVIDTLDTTEFIPIFSNLNELKRTTFSITYTRPQAPFVPTSLQTSRTKHHGKDKGKTCNGSANTQPHKGQTYINDARVSDNEEQLELNNPTFCNRFIHTLKKVLGQSFKHESKETLQAILDDLCTDQATQNATQGGYPEVFGLLTQVLGKLATAFNKAQHVNGSNQRAAPLAPNPENTATESEDNNKPPPTKQTKPLKAPLIDPDDTATKPEDYNNKLPSGRFRNSGLAAGERLLGLPPSSAGFNNNVCPHALPCSNATSAASCLVSCSMLANPSQSAPPGLPEDNSSLLQLMDDAPNDVSDLGSGCQSPSLGDPHLDSSILPPCTAEDAQSVFSTC
ncbi:hypothetical protein RHS03_08908, partial [Rhizoctonia solani]